MNANPDFCMNFHAHIRVGIHGSFFFLMTLVHSFVSLPPSLTQRGPYCGPCGVLSFLCRYTTQAHMAKCSEGPVLYFRTMQCSAIIFTALT